MLKSVGNLSVRSGDQTIVDGNLVIGTADKGVDFSASSHAPGMTSELLNDYEEGAWTPVIVGSTGAGTYELAAETNCLYTKIGRQVTLVALIRLAAAVTGGGTGSLNITGVPYAKASNQIPVGSTALALGTFSGAPPTVQFTSYASSSSLFLQQDASGGYGTAIPISYASANAYIGFTLTYFV